MDTRINKAWTVLSVLLALIALAVGITALRHQHRPDDSRTDTAPKLLPSLLERCDKTGEMHAGYGVYPPYTMEDPKSQRVSGLSVELLEHVAKELKCKLVWHRLNWNTMAADLKRGQFDIIADPIFQTIPRAREFAFSEPYAYFADGIGVVRKSDQRFSDFNSIDRPGVKVAVGQGWASETFVRARVAKATIVAVQTGTDLLQLFNEVVSGRADIAIADGADAERFAREHPEQVTVLWLDSPPAWVPAGFALRFTDSTGAQFMNISLRSLRSLGVLDSLAEKYGVPPPRDMR